MLGQPTPNDADPTGEWYAFEKGAGKAEGGDGWADVWMRDHFAWEYKGKRKDLAAAYSQLNGYREALGNPPLLVVCDLARFEIHTNFTNTVPRVYRFTLDDLAADPGEPLRILRAGYRSSTGARSSLPSSGRCSSADSTPTSVPSSAPTTPTELRSCGLSSP